MNDHMWAFMHELLRDDYECALEICARVRSAKSKWPPAALLAPCLRCVQGAAGGRRRFASAR